MTVLDDSHAFEQVPAVRWSARDLAKALGQPYAPTPEQTAVIEAPLRPMLVVAGAGSGKTETMAARVVYLVANALVEPEEILGLTFTRKAAGELAERLSSRLATLAEAGLWTPRSEDGALVVGEGPTVSTYHAYAAALVRDHGLRLGIESESRLLSEAAAWQFAHDAVASYDGDLEGVDKAESTVTTAVVDLAGELAEHLSDPDALERHLTFVIEALEAVPKGGSRRKQFPAPMREAVAVLRERRELTVLLRRYAELKRSRDAMDFADQMALAARLATQVPSVGAGERARFKAIFLDEFQDTSEAQLVLLRSLFVAAGEPVPVTAVGDPHQSIYGWRGASSTTLPRFRSDFVDPEPATVRHLSTSWRNDRAILDVANVIAGPLAAGTHIPVVPLTARPDAGRGHVATARLETIEAEAAHIAAWLGSRRRRPDRATAAVLCRKRSQFAPIIDALESLGLPYEVVGLGGLLHTPEVADLVALLWVVADPTRGDHLMRLLTGPSTRLGAADLDGLAEWSRVLQRRRTATSDGGDAARRDLAPDSADRASIVEAIDDLPPPEWVGRDGQRLSAIARERLAGLSEAIRQVRGLAGLGLAELVMEAELALGLDIEVQARAGWSPGAARAHLDAFADVAARYAASSDRTGLGGFLSWLDAAIDEERGLDLGWVEARPDAISVMTVHAAKGLEWDCVAVPGLVEASFPAHSARPTKVVAGEWTHATPNDKGWLGGLATLPYDLRGDADGLPHLAWRHLADWDDVASAYTTFLDEVARHGITEERRLAYVAVTRARRDLLLTAHVWGSARTPRVTSRFVDEVRAAEPEGPDRPWVPMPASDGTPVENPRLAEQAQVSWPVQETGQRRDTVADAADRVVAATTSTDEPRVVTKRWAGEIDLLLRERAARARSGALEVPLPAHLSTSELITLAADPVAYAAALRRPMPPRPDPASRRGTAFHSWVEQHYSRAAFVDVDDLPGAADDDGSSDDLDRLRERFLASQWAERMPIDVETSLETVIGGIALRGRVDAVFEDVDDEGRARWTVLDWKTGLPPSGGRAEVRALQLGVYRLAWARLRGVPEEHVRGAFFYAVTGETVWPDLPSEAEIADLLAEVISTDVSDAAITAKADPPRN